MSKRIIIAAVAFIAISSLYFLVNLSHLFLISMVDKGVITSIKVYPGERAKKIADKLVSQQLISHPKLFHWLVDITGDRYHLRYGEYEIKYPLTAWQLLHNMKKGTGLLQHRLTIVNGWTFNDVRDAITLDLDLNQTIKDQSNEAVMKALGSTETHAEGLFYPDTYFFTWGNTDLSVLKTAYQKMRKTLQADWKNRAANLPYKNAYQALIAASLIEKETALINEKPMIASVIINRLEKHMRLQIDPTVMYGLNKTFGITITKKDLATQTPYNTYLIDGLPPTPICMPSESSIQAALHPAKTDYLYYVANGAGGHNFSKTYAEHEKQVNQYKQITKNG